MGTWEPGTDQG